MKLIISRGGYWYVVLRSDHGEVTSCGFATWGMAWAMSLIPGYPAMRSSVGL
jgi:hypothetical protein